MGASFRQSRVKVKREPPAPAHKKEVSLRGKLDHFQRTPMGSNAMQAPENKQEADLPPLPTFDSGGAFVDVADRDTLDKVMEESSAPRGVGADA